MEAALPQPGATFCSRWRLGRKLGGGGMGVVYEAEDVRLGTRAAIKVLLPQLADDSSMRERFVREARAAAALNHPSVVNILDVDISETGVPFIAMEFLDGVDLGAHLRGLTDPLLWPQASGLAWQLCEALVVAHHKSIVHRDLKPENCMVVSDVNGALAIKIVDFGIAKLMDGSESPLTETGVVCGTPGYIAPEQCDGRKHVDSRVDLYAVGAIVYRMVTGRPPYVGNSLAQVMYAVANSDPIPPGQFADLPAGAEAWILRALHKDPDSRFRSASEMLTALRPLIPIRAQEQAYSPTAPLPLVGSRGIARHWRGRGMWPSRQVAARLGWLLLAVVTSSAALWWQGHRERTDLSVADDAIASLGSPEEISDGVLEPPTAPGGRSRVSVHPRVDAPVGESSMASLTGLAVDDSAGASASRPESPRAATPEGSAVRVEPSSRQRATKHPSKRPPDKPPAVKPPAVNPDSPVGVSGPDCAELPSGCAGERATTAADPALASDNAGQTVRVFVGGCKQHSAAACVRLGDLYASGAGGIVRDETKAMWAYRDGCSAGAARGCRKIAEMYQAGTGGLPRSRSQADQFLGEACRLGDRRACRRGIQLPQ